MGFNQPTYTVQELEQDLVDFDQLSGQSESEPAAYNCPIWILRLEKKTSRKKLDHLNGGA